MKSVEDAYDKYAQAYSDYLEERLPQFLLTKFISLLPENPTVLDAGCAAGRDSIYLAEEGLKVTGIDLSEKILEIAIAKSKEANVDVAFRNEDINSMTSENQTYDGVWCIDTLNHISRESLTDVFRELSRVLKVRGILFISSVAGQEEGAVKLEYMDEDVFFSRHDQIELETSLVDTGFEIIDSTFESANSDLHVNIFARKI